MCSPRPVPPSLRRVVKNGSKAWRWTSGVIPAPLSAKMISMSSLPRGLAEMVMAPARPPGNAWFAALRNRFVRICPYEPGKPSTTRPSGTSTDKVIPVLRVALGDGVLAEHLDRARHCTDLVLGIGARHLTVVVARPDRPHRGHDLLQGQPDTQRNNHPRGDDDGQEKQRDRQHPVRDIAQ